MLKNAISLAYMIYFSPAKINLGLQILEKREDGFHNLSSVMYPIALCDIIEISQLPGQENHLQFTQSGITVDGDPEENLCMKAWNLIRAERPLSNLAIHLHKQIPVGAGLGGGSSNASTVLLALNALTHSPLSSDRLQELAEKLGSDCPFFLQSLPMMMEGRGEILSQVALSLNSFHLVLLFPEIHISTAEAYSLVKPRLPEMHLRQLIEAPLSLWQGRVVNDFEQRIFEKYPLLARLKQKLYRAGAVYASMSGSGSSLYGIFEKPPELPEEIRKLVIWSGEL